MKRKVLAFLISFMVCFVSVSTPVMADEISENSVDETTDEEALEEKSEEEPSEKESSEAEDSETEVTDDYSAEDETTDIVSGNENKKTVSDNEVTIVSENNPSIDAYGDAVLSGRCGDNVNYELETNQSGLYTLSITGSGDMSSYIDGELVGIPWYSYQSSISEIKIANGITYIEDRMFNGCTALESIAIPSSVKRIGDEVFKDCSNLQTVQLVNGLEQLGARVFQGCTSLKNIVLPQSVTAVGMQSFSGCTDLENAIFPSGLTTIPEYVFCGCSSLDEFVICNGVNVIKDSAFEGCSSLSKITIPNTVTELGNQVFNNCDSLNEIIVPDSVTSIGTHCFSESDNLETAVLPASLTEIPLGLFYKCQSLESVNIPSGVTSIGKFAFEDCRKLKAIELPTGLTSIGEFAFKSCYELTEIVIPSGVTSIKNNTFWSCINLKKVILPGGVTSIGDSAFYFCNKLEDISMPDSLITIGESTFDSCYSLKTISLKNNVTTIGSKAFSNCTNLGRVTILDSVTSIAADAFENSLLVLILCNSGSSAATFADNNGITKMIIGSAQQYNGSCGTDATWNLDCKTGLLVIDGTGAMNDYTNSDTAPWLGYAGFISAVEIKNGITKIGDNSFKGCTSLTKLTIPKSVTEIGNDCFRGCSSLPELYIPSGTILIRSWAFEGCSNLKKVIFSSDDSIDADSMLVIDICVFRNCSAIKEVWIYQNAISMTNSTFSDCTNVTLYGHYYGSSSGYVKQKSSVNTFAASNNINFVSVDKYSIVFNGNGATRGRVGSITDCEMGTDYPLPGNSFVRRGYKFDNWNGNSAGIGRKYHPGDNVKDLLKEGSYTFYAIWTPISYTVNFNANGGSGLSASSQNYTYDVSSTLIGAPTKAGYSFTGWNTRADGTGTMYGAGSVVKNLTEVDGDTIVLYAQWGEQRYQISYNLNGGINNPDNPTEYSQSSGAIVLKNPVRTGYTFGGWYSNSGLSNKVTQINAGSTGNKTLYAKWSENSYKISFKSCGGKGKMKTLKTTYSKAVKLTKCGFTRTVTVKKKVGKKTVKIKKKAKFLGWALTPGGAVVYKNGSKVKGLSGNDNSTVILYAVWNK